MTASVTSKRSPWPYAIVMFFIMLALFDAYIVSQALRTRTGTVTEQPYEDGLRYERTILARQAAREAGIKLTYDLNHQPAVISVHGLSLPGTKTLELKLLKPEAPGFDRSVSMTTSSNEFILGNLQLKSGLWMIEALITVNGAEFYFESREIVGL